MAVNEKSPLQGLKSKEEEQAKDRKFNVDFQGLNAPEVPENKWLQIAMQHIVSQYETPPEPEAIFSLNGIPVFTKKSLSTIIAKAKAGKTTVTAWMVAQMLLNGIRILWIDTEQGLYYSSRTQYWVLSIAGLTLSENLDFFDLKTFPPNERIEIIIALLGAKEYDIIVLDGVRDLVFDINKPEEATIITSHLMKWAEECNIHIINILHENKGDGNARGHLGTELMNKSETVMRISQEDEGQNMIIEPAFTRGKPFDTFALYRDENGIPSLVVGWEKKERETARNKKSEANEFPEEVHIEALQKVYSGSNNKMTSGDFVTALSAAWPAIGGEEMATSRAKKFRAFYIQNGYINAISKQSGNKTLNILSEKYIPKELVK